MRLDDARKTATLTIGYWGPFRSGKSLSLDYVRAKMEGLSFEPDDAPFVPSLVAARAASPMMITGGRWTKTGFSTIREHRLDLELIDWSGFPADVPLGGGFHHRAARLAEIEMRGAAHAFSVDALKAAVRIAMERAVVPSA